MDYRHYVELLSIPTIEPTEFILSTMSPSTMLSSFTMPPSTPSSSMIVERTILDGDFNIWTFAVIVSIMSSTITTVCLLCAGTYVRMILKKEYLRSLESDSTSDLESVPNDHFKFSDVYDESQA